MAKKKRKSLIKLNNKIKSLFNNKPFEDAIVEVNDNTLYGLLMLLGDDIGSLERDDIIKYLRRVWSEGNYNTRKVIVEFLEDSFKEVLKEKKDKVDLILSFLDGIETTPAENEIILAEFMDKKLAKITKEKVLGKLNYIRVSNILRDFEDKLDIKFIGDNSIEFYHTQTFSIEDSKNIVHNFELNMLSSIKLDMSVDKLASLDSKDALEYLNNFKELAIKEKKEQLDEFLKNIKNIDILESDDLIKIFKSIKEPITNLYHCPIPLKIVKSALLKMDKDLEVVINKNNFLITKKFDINLFEKVLNYNVNIEYEKNVLYSLIWTNKIDIVSKDISDSNEQLVENFNSFISNLNQKLKESAKPLELEESYYKRYILNFIEPIVKLNNSIKLKNKVAKRALYYFSEEIKAKKEQAKKEELLAKTIRDFKQLFPVARSLNREIIFHVGPTNSGKTYSALKELKEAESGVYLAPLRLLALEGYEDLKQSGIDVSLITGEEEIINEDSTHISSTIEMLNSDIEVDVCVIDEIQMISDRDRGWAWANALIGAPAKKVILTGSQDALDVVKEIANYLNEPLKIVHFERKNPLIVQNKPTNLKNLEKGTAIVTFSRKEVLALKSKVAPFFNVSVVYGNLSPEVRREEARRFREGESDILIATDAISMGLNLPIKTILFAKDNKFDGLRRRELTTTEVLQISGRAGRYGLHESGYVGALDHPTLLTIKEKFNQKLPPIKLPISIMASLEHILLIGEILQTNSLLEILEFFSSNMEFEGPFVAANIDSMMELAKIVDEYNLDLVSKYNLACAPVSISSPYLEKVFHRYLKLLEEDKVVNFIDVGNLPNKANSYMALLNAEDRVKEVSLYLWLSFKFKDKFIDTQIAKESRDKLNSYIEKSLKESNFTKNCKNCGKELDLTYKFSICDSCYNRLRRGYRKKK